MEIVRFVIEVEVEDDQPLNSSELDSLLTKMEDIASRKGYSIHNQEWKIVT